MTHAFSQSAFSFNLRASGVPENFLFGGHLSRFCVVACTRRRSVRSWPNTVNMYAPSHILHFASAARTGRDQALSLCSNRRPCTGETIARPGRAGISPLPNEVYIFLPPISGAQPRGNRSDGADLVSRCVRYFLLLAPFCPAVFLLLSCSSVAQRVLTLPGGVASIGRFRVVFHFANPASPWYRCSPSKDYCYYNHYPHNPPKLVGRPCHPLV